MNKYKEALNNLCKKCEKNINSIPIQTKENETYDIHHCGYQMCPYRIISNDYCEEYDTLRELIDKVKWHNLDNDSTDLPKEKGEYLVAIELYVPYGPASTIFTTYRLCKYEDGKFFGYDSISERIIAWKYRGKLGDDYE